MTVLLSLLGLRGLFREDRVMGHTALLWLGGTLLFAAVYQIGDWQSYLVPCWVMLALLASVGAAEVAAWPRGRLVMGLWIVGLVVWTTSNALALRIDDNRWDRSLLLAATEPSGVAVTYLGPGYRSRQFNRYYRFGLGMEEAGGYEIQTGVEALEERFTHLGEQRLFFRGKRVQRLFDRHRVDYSMRWLADDIESTYFVTGTRFPLSAVHVTYGDDGGFLLERDSGESIASVRGQIGALVVSPAERRIKGFSTFDFNEVVERRRRAPKHVPELVIEAFLDAVMPGDWLLVVLHDPALDLESEVMRRVFSRLDLRPDDTRREGDALVVHGVKGEPLGELDATQLTGAEGVILEIPS